VFSFKTVIYVLQDINGEIRYVGKTKKPLERRLSEHISESRSGRQTHKCNWIRKCLSEGYLPLMKEIDSVENEDGCLQEIYWIDRFIREGCDLVNATLGGEGLRATEETRLKLSLWQKGKPKLNQRGISHSSEHCRKISEALKGRLLSIEHRRKLAKAKLWKKRMPHSEETKRKISLAHLVRREETRNQTIN